MFSDVLSPYNKCYTVNAALVDQNHPVNEKEEYLDIYLSIKLVLIETHRRPSYSPDKYLQLLNHSGPCDISKTRQQLPHLADHHNPWPQYRVSA